MSRKLVRGRHVVTDPDRLPGEGFRTDTSLLVTDGLVTEVGDWRTLRERYTDVDVIGPDRHLVLPGFVNAHHHGRGLSGLQLGMSDDYLERWILDFLRMPPLDVHLDTLFSAKQMMRSGVTTVVHHAYARDPGALVEETDQALTAYRDAGIRVTYALGIDDELKLVDGDNDAFTAGLDAELAARADDDTGTRSSR